MSTFINDPKYAFRMLAKRPGVTLVMLVTLLFERNAQRVSIPTGEALFISDEFIRRIILERNE